MVFGSIATTMPIFVKIGVGHGTQGPYLVHSLVLPLLILREEKAAVSPDVVSDKNLQRHGGGAHHDGVDEKCVDLKWRYYKV